MKHACNQCPIKAGDTYLFDCTFPYCIGWSITYNPKPIPDRRYDYDFVHEDYDGPGNGLCGTAASVIDAIEQIAEIEEDDRFSENNANI